MAFESIIYLVGESFISRSSPFQAVGATYVKDLYQI